MGSLSKLLKKLDMNPSTEDSFKERTLTGALISVITIILMGSLFWGEFKLYITNQRVEDMVVDKETTDQTRISFSIDLPYLPCDLIQVGYRDALGNDRVDIENEILKTNLDVNGNTIGNTDVTKLYATAPTKEEVLGEDKMDDNSTGECGSCFGAGAEGECCNTCEQLIDAYRRKQWNVDRIIRSSPQCKNYDYLSKWKNGVNKGCRIEGHLSISKVQGHIFIVPARINDYLPLYQLQQIIPTLNVTHTIHSFSLGEDIINQQSPFNEHPGIMTTDHASMYQYFVNAIPTTYIDDKGNTIKSYQVTETHHMRPLQDQSSLIPGVYFVYDFSPLRAVVKETHLPLFELCTSLCAILGGVFTVMGMVDSLFYSMGKKVQRKSKSTDSDLTPHVNQKSE